MGRHRAPLKAALLCCGLALGSFSTFGWDRESEAFQFGQALTKRAPPCLSHPPRAVGELGIWLHPPALLWRALCHCPAQSRLQGHRWRRCCRGRGQMWDCCIFLEWCPGCPTLLSQPRLGQCQCWHHRHLLTTARSSNTTVLMSACTPISFPNLWQIMRMSSSSFLYASTQKQNLLLLLVKH